MSQRPVRLEVFHFRHALARAVPTTMGMMTCRPAILIRIEAEDGAAGWGEVWCNFPPDGDFHRARLAANVLPAALAGLEPGSEEACFATIRARLHRLALQAGEPGPVNQVAAAADMALNDLAARRAGVAMAVHLGGEARAVPAYASGISPAQFESQFERMRAFGFHRFKQRIGFGADDGIGELETAAAHLRPGERLMADANQAWDLETAIARGRRLAPLDLIWLEEPLPVDAPDADWRAFAAEAPMPLAGGENMGAGNDFLAAIGLGALTYLQPDICKWGGLSGCLDVARTAHEAGRTHCPHYLGSGGVGLIASAHLLAASGGPGLLEVDSSENPLLEHFTPHGLALGEDGTFPLPPGAGIGYEPDVACAAHALAERRESRISE